MTSILYRAGYVLAVTAAFLAEVVIDITGPTCDCSHGAVKGDMLLMRKESGVVFNRFREVT